MKYSFARCFPRKWLKMPQKGPKPLSNIINFNAAQFIIIEYHCDCFRLSHRVLRAGIPLQDATKRLKADDRQLKDDQSEREKFLSALSILFKLIDDAMRERTMSWQEVLRVESSTMEGRRRRKFFTIVCNILFLSLPPPSAGNRLMNDLLMVVFMSGAQKGFRKQLAIIGVHFRTGMTRHTSLTRMAVWKIVTMSL